MFQNIGYILICFLIAFVAFKGLMFVLEDNYGIRIPAGQKVYISDNQGEDWMAIKQAPKGMMSGANFAFDPINSQNLYLASSSGILKSANRGKNFKSQDTSFKLGPNPSLISKFISHPSDSEIIYLISEEMGKNKLLISNDGGESFESIYVSGSGDEITSFAPDPFTPRYLYIGTEKGMFLKSDDYGNSWNKKQVFGQEIKEIVVNPHIQYKNKERNIETREVYIILEFFKSSDFSPMRSYKPSKIFISKSFGDNFVEFRGDIGEAAKIVFDLNIKNRMYFVSESFVKRLDGSRLERLDLLLPSDDDEIYSFTIDPKNSNILYVGAGELLYVSENDGEDWQIIEPPTRGEVKEIKVNPVDSNTLLLSISEIW